MNGVDLSGKVAVITGAGTGIGAGTALQLAQAGADVVLHYRVHATHAEEIAAACRALGRRAETIAGDFASDPAACNAFSATIGGSFPSCARRSTSSTAIRVGM